MRCRIVLAWMLLLPASAAFAQERQSSVLPDRSLKPAVTGSIEASGPDRPPRFVSGKSPVYPISMLLSRKGGGCTIEFTVGIDGKPKEFTVVSSPGKFADHAIIAIGSWTFEPAMKDGVPVEARVRQTFSFRAR